MNFTDYYQDYKSNRKLILSENQFAQMILMLPSVLVSFSDGEFEKIITAPNNTYKDYKTYKQRFERMRPLFYVLYKMDMVPKSFYLKYTRKYIK